MRLWLFYGGSSWYCVRDEEEVNKTLSRRRVCVGLNSPRAVYLSIIIYIYIYGLLIIYSHNLWLYIAVNHARGLKINWICVLCYALNE